MIIGCPLGVPVSGRVSDLISACAESLDERGSGTYLVAYSGGIDSHVLLHIFSQLRDRGQIQSLRAVHVHHGLSVEADAWAAHCATVCAALKVELVCHRVDAVAAVGESPEAAARTARYRALQSELAEGDVLLTAHNQDDQAETILLQLLRGAGVKGLAAMPVSKRFGSGYLLRPLLGQTREVLEAYARDEGLVWVEDGSNVDLRYGRNYLRHKVMPALRARWPSVAASLSRSARHCAEASDYIAQRMAVELESLLVEGDSNRLLLSGLRGYSEVEQRGLIRAWCVKLGVAVPNTAQLGELLGQALGSRAGAKWCVRWANVVCQPDGDVLWLCAE